MNSIEDLQEVFRRREGLAPDGAGIVEGARVGAVRIRRRHRLTAVAGGLAVVVAAVPVTVAVIQSDRSPVVAASHGPLIPRGSTELTVDLDGSGSDYVMSAGATDGAQSLSVRGAENLDSAYAKIEVINPGGYDPTILTGGEPVTVRGKPARYRPAGRLTWVYATGSVPPRPTPSGPFELSVFFHTVAWLDQGGVLVVVTAKDRENALAYAERVRFGPARPVTAPYALSYLPAGLRPVHTVRNWDGGTSQSILSLDEVTDPPLAGGMDLFVGREVAVLINSLNLDDYFTSHTEPLGPPTKIAGHDVWYRDRYVEGDGLHVAAGHSVMMVKAGDCGFLITVADKVAVPYSELVKMIEGATFRSCADVSGWVDPIP